MKICHLTSAHPYYDDRIFLKECRSLSEAGFEVYFVAPGAPDTIINGVRLQGFNRKNQSRLIRASVNLWHIYQEALAVDADVYHFHDPDLLIVGYLLKKKNKKVIYDSHENFPKDILDKEWIPKASRRLISRFYETFENKISKHLDLVITASPVVYNRFRVTGCNTLNINNYPLSEELVNLPVNWQTKQKAVCYLGGINSKRGIFEMVAALKDTDIELLLAGTFTSDSQREQAMAMRGWNNVNELGQIDREGVRKVLQESMAGLSILHPIPSYTYALATKMFEYMAAGIPVIASNFPLWEDIVNNSKCGICVDPLNIQEIADAIKWIFTNHEEARRMGENGRRAVIEKYNWENESKKLIQFYENNLS